LENVLATCALFISVVSLVTAIIFGRSQMRHEKNSVVPFVEFMFFDSEPQFYVKLKNVGMGPMIIESMIVTLDDIEKASIMSCFKSIIPREEMKKYYDFEYGRIISKDRVLSPDSELFFISLKECKDIEIVKDNDYYNLVARLADTFRRIKIKIVFRDIYGKEFTAERNLEEYFYAWYAEHLT